MVKAAAIVTRGLEKTAKSEFESFGAEKIETGDGFLTFDVKNYIDIAKAAYIARTASRIFLLLGNVKIGKKLDKKIFSKSIEKAGFSTWMNKETTFKAVCERMGEHNFSSTDFEAALGEAVIEKIKKDYGYKQKVRMDSPDVIIFSHIIDDACLVGVDFCGFDLSKRDYNIFTSRASIKGTLAASMLFFSGVSPKMRILDPMCGSGNIVIEAALYSKGASPHGFRKENYAFKKLLPMKGVNFDDFFKSMDEKEKKMKITGYDPLHANANASSKNAKIAGIHKSVEISRSEVDWLDTKVKAASVDLVITRLPSHSQTLSKKSAEKLYKEFFYCADYILKKGGRITLLLLKEGGVIGVANQYKFKVVDNINILIGKQPATIITFARA